MTEKSAGELARELFPEGAWIGFFDFREIETGDHRVWVSKPTGWSVKCVAKSAWFVGMFKDQAGGKPDMLLRLEIEAVRDQTINFV